MKGYDVVKPPILPSGRALLLCALLLLASGCTIRFHTDVVLNPDDTASLNLIFGVRFEEELPPGADEGMEELDAASAEEDFRGDAEACGFPSDAVTVVDYTEEDFQGIELTLTNIPIEAVECVFAEDPESPFEEFSIVREGDDYVFNGRISGEALSGDLGGQKRQVAQEEAPAELPEDFPTEFGEPEFDGRVQVTFPGEISEHNATRVEGNTAIWEFGFDQDVDMMAVGSAGEGGGSSTVLFIIIAAVVLLVLLIIGLLVARSRGKAKGAASYAGAPGAFGGPHGPGYGGPGGGAPPGPGVGGPPGSSPPGGGPGGYAPPPGAATPGGGIYGAPPGGAAPGAYGGPGGAPQGQPPQGQPPYGQPPQGQPPQGQPPQGQPPQGQPPQGQPPQGPGGWQQPPGGTPPASGQPQQQPGEPPQQPPGEGGGFDAGSTRTFRPEDLLPPEDPNQR